MTNIPYKRLSYEEAKKDPYYDWLFEFFKKQVELEVKKTDGDIVKDWTRNEFKFYRDKDQTAVVGNYNYVTGEITTN